MVWFIDCCCDQVRKPKRRTNPAAAQNTANNSVACLNSSHHPQLHWPEFGYLLDKIAAAASAARKKGRSKQQQQQQVELPPGLQQMGPEVAPVLDWQDAAAAEQREQEALLADDADAGACFSGYFTPHVPVSVVMCQQLQHDLMLDY